MTEHNRLDKFTHGHRKTVEQALEFGLELPFDLDDLNKIGSDIAGRNWRGVERDILYSPTLELGHPAIRVRACWNLYDALEAILSTVLRSFYIGDRARYLACEVTTIVAELADEGATRLISSENEVLIPSEYLCFELSELATVEVVGVLSQFFNWCGRELSTTRHKDFIAIKPTLLSSNFDLKLSAV